MTLNPFKWLLNYGAKRDAAFEAYINALPTAQVVVVFRDDVFPRYSETVRADYYGSSLEDVIPAKERAKMRAQRIADKGVWISDDTFIPPSSIKLVKVEP